MKTPRILPVTLAVSILAGWLLLDRTSAQTTKVDASTQEVMKAKLAASQRVLEGIALEDFEIIAVNGRKMAKLSQGTSWRARQTPEYDLFTTEYRRHVDALVLAAEKKNVDAASLAYFQITQSCVSCHRYMRNVRSADAR
ncbi:MAG TPA: hypothetical protein VK968_15740 [Roseimicrobium sp.]|nr:hypothetical protein [Roseimicrobium sp.]